MRIKIIKDQEQYTAGQTITVKRDVGFRLIGSGVAIASKDMINTDMIRKVAHGNTN